MDFEEVIKVHDVPVYYYSVPEKVLASRENKCFCQRAKDVRIYF